MVNGIHLIRAGVFLHPPQDQFQELYAQTGRFPGPTLSLPRRAWSLLNWLVWAGLLLYPLGLVLAQLVQSGSTCSVLASLCLCSMGRVLGQGWGVRSVLQDTSSDNS